MSRAAKIALTVGISLVCDGMIFYLFYQQARIKDAEPTGLWWLSTITIAVLALAPLYELARKPASWSALSPRYSPFSRHAGWPSAFMRPMMHLIEIQAWPNQSAPGNAGIEPRLTIGYLTPGVPEPERSAARRA
jgi:hypothetical protein